jgi:hypothetical protein
MIASVLDGRTVSTQGDLTMPSTFRQLYRPKPDRAPAWVRRIWFWL